MCRITNFTAVENAATRGTDATAYLLPAGANKLLSDNSTTANQCAYSSEANRNAMRGGPWVAITADIPQASVYVSSSAVPVLAPLQLFISCVVPCLILRKCCVHQKHVTLLGSLVTWHRCNCQSICIKLCSSAVWAAHLQSSICCPGP